MESIENKTLSNQEEQDENQISGRKINRQGMVSYRGKVITLGAENKNKEAVELIDGVIAIVNEDKEIDKIYEIPNSAVLTEKGNNIHINKNEITELNINELPEDLKAKLEELKGKLQEGASIDARTQGRTEGEYFEEYKLELIRFLEEEKIVEYGDKGEIICDLEKIKGINHSALEGRGMRNTKRNGQVVLNWQKALFEIFFGRQVYSKEDYEKKIHGDSKIEPKPLFYAPSKEQAFDEKAIATAEFYLTPLEINGKPQSINAVYREELGYSAEEAEIALRVYGSQYGQGDRNNDGKLLVINNRGKYVSISSDWMRKHAFSSKFWSSPRRELGKDKYANLRESGLLTKDDFNFQETSPMGQKLRGSKTIRENGSISANTYFEDEEGKKRSLNAQYALGEDFTGKEIVKLTDNQYGIVTETHGLRNEGLKMITHIFRPSPPEIIRKKQAEYKEKHGKEPRSGSISIGLRDDDFPGIEKLQESKFIQPQREGESDEKFYQRIAEFNAVRNYSQLEILSDALSEKADIGLHNLSLQEQNCITTYAFQKGDKNFDRLVAFCKEYGEAGIKTFLSCEYGTDMGDKIVALGETLDRAIAEKIFAKYNEVATLAQEESDQLVADMTDKEITEKEKLSIREHLLHRGKKLLEDFYLLAKNKSPKELLDRLEQIKTDIMLFTATFKSLAKRGEVSLAEINGVELETKPAEDLSPAEKDEMMRIFLGNRVSGYSEKRLATWTSEFSEAMESKEATFYIVRTSGKIVSFIRSQPTEDDKIYIGSLNVRPEAKSSQLGTAMMKEVVDKLAENNIVTCLINAKKKDLLEFFRQKLKFKTTEIKNNYKGSGEMYLQLERNDLGAMKRSQESLAA